MNYSKLSYLEFHNIRNMMSILITPFYNSAYKCGGLFTAACELQV